MKNNMKFEEALEKLEGLVTSLEDGKLSLDEAINSYEEAIKLIRVCSEKLENAEEKVRILTKSSDGSVTDLPFDCGDEA